MDYCQSCSGITVENLSAEYLHSKHADEPPWKVPDDSCQICTHIRSDRRLRTTNIHSYYLLLDPKGFIHVFCRENSEVGGWHGYFPSATIFRIGAERGRSPKRSVAYNQNANEQKEAIARSNSGTEAYVGLISSPTRRQIQKSASASFRVTLTNVSMVMKAAMHVAMAS